MVQGEPESIRDLENSGRLRHTVVYCQTSSFGIGIVLPRKTDYPIRGTIRDLILEVETEIGRYHANFRR